MVIADRFKNSVRKQLNCTMLYQFDLVLVRHCGHIFEIRTDLCLEDNPK